MTDQYTPATRWARAVLAHDAHIERLKRETETHFDHRRAAMDERCPLRPDSGGARCTGDAGHEDRCAYHPERDMPEPFTLRGMTWWEDDRWDRR